MKIVILSSHTSSLFWFRMDMMKDMMKENCEVIAIGHDSEEEWKGKFKNYGIEYRAIKIERNGLNPLSDINTLLSIYSVLKEVKPDKIFIYQAKTIVYGSIAASLLGIKDIYLLFAGLGSVFRGNGLKNKVVKSIMKFQYRVACKLSKKVFFQNNDDKYEFISSNLVAENKVVMMNGSGVNLEKFKPSTFHGNPVFLFVGRLIKDKGITEYLEACKVVKNKYPNTRCLVIGPFDSNPTSLKEEELSIYEQAGVIEYYGEQSDVRPFLKECSVFVLPSYHEGTPKSVLEAMAMNRAIITTDAPGCRETVQDGVNGFLVPVKNVKALADKMIYFVENRDEIERAGTASLEICREKFDVHKINNTIIHAMEIKKELEVNWNVTNIDERINSIDY